MRLLTLLFLAACVLTSGCKDPNAKEVVAENVEPDDGQGIFNKTTDEIGEFDPDAENTEVVDDKVKGMSPLNPMNALKAYGPAVQKISKLHITQALRLFEAEKGRMPKDYDEFMTEIIKKNNIELPILPGNRKYQYDVQNHELVVVQVKKESESEGK